MSKCNTFPLFELTSLSSQSDLSNGTIQGKEGGGILTVKNRKGEPWKTEKKVRWWREKTLLTAGQAEMAICHKKIGDREQQVHAHN